MVGHKEKRFLDVFKLTFGNSRIFFLGKLYTSRPTDSRFAKTRNLSETPKFTFTETLTTPITKILDLELFAFVNNGAHHPSRAQARASETQWVRNFWEIYPCEKFWLTSRTPVRTDCWGWQPRRTGVFRQFSLKGNHVAALHLATRVFLEGNHISEEQRDKG